MTNIHIIFSEWGRSQVATLEKFGIKVEPGYASFTIQEGETYFKLRPYLDSWSITDDVITKFSDEDLNRGSILVLRDTWANGYPMPDGDRGYLKTTYDEKDYCSKCGMGLLQKEPFRLKAEPKWGNKKIFSLNWVYDEIFVRKDFYEEKIKKFGIGFSPVLLYKKDTVIVNTVQLNIPTVKCSLHLDGYDYEVCESCKRRRYNLINKGLFPSFQETLDSASYIFKSIEYFGTGANARKYIFLSQEVRQLFLKEKIKANFIPCT